jgi:hypothetical protein
MKKCIPTKLTSLRNPQPWINRNINKLTRKKNQAHKKKQDQQTINQGKISMSKRDKEVT